MEKTDSRIVPKKWGHEKIICNNEKYCGKILVFNENAQFSMHYHMIKHETWYVLEGEFKLKHIDTSNAEQKEIFLKQGDAIAIEPGQPHQLQAGKEGGSIMEVSTEHFDNDSYRVWR